MRARLARLSTLPQPHLHDSPNVSYHPPLRHHDTSYRPQQHIHQQAPPLYLRNHLHWGDHLYPRTTEGNLWVGHSLRVVDGLDDVVLCEWYLQPYHLHVQ